MRNSDEQDEHWIQVLHRYLWGTDSWFGDALSKESDFAKNIEKNNKKVVESMLNNTVTPLRDRHIIEGAKIAVLFERIDILALLFSNNRAKNCLMAHQNLFTYRKETGDWGIMGNLYSFFPPPRQNEDEPEYENLLIFALNLDKPVSNKLLIIDLLLKTGLFDINKKYQKKLRSEMKFHDDEQSFHPFQKDTAWDRNKSWYEYDEQSVIKTPIYIACESGDTALVKRILEEKNVDLTVSCCDDKNHVSNQFEFKNVTKLTSSTKTPLELAQAKGFNNIASLLKQYQSTSISSQKSESFKREPK